jgi:hypothetical protein
MPRATRELLVQSERRCSSTKYSDELVWERNRQASSHRLGSPRRLPICRNASPSPDSRVA